MSLNGLKNIHPGATIGQNVTIEAFATIQEDVVIGEGTWIGPNVVLMNGTRIGKNCKVFPGAILGGEPQDLKYEGEYTTLEIGDNVTIREYCTINKGTRANNRTVIGDNCLIMAYVHVAHDCVLGKNVIIANNSILAGHVEMDDFSRLSGMVAVHQFVKIGKYSMVSAQTFATKDVPPYIIAARSPLAYSSVNSIGLKRNGFSKKQVNEIENIYRTLYLKNYNTSQAVAIIQDILPNTEERHEVVNFIEKSSKGIITRNRNRNLNGTGEKIRR